MVKPMIMQMGSYPVWDEAALNDSYDVRRYFEAPDKAAFLAQNGAGIRAIATRGELGASRAVIEACPQLELISVFGVGYDAVDLAACRDHGIRVTNTPDVLTDDVADLAVAMLLAVARGLIGAEDWVRSGDWARGGDYPLQRRVWGQRAGILGLGRIGQAVVRRLHGFGMEVSYCATAAKAGAEGMRFVADPVALARDVDFLFVTLAASDKTRHIVGQEVIAALGPEGILINVSRGSNVDEGALLAALESGGLGAAALDVFDNEPAIDPQFLSLRNVLLQPHHGSATVATRKAMGQLVRDNLAAHFTGKPLLTPVL
ncbi:MAG: 2-hydroxyacid dehydrogenase [Tropicimonas sp.]|uniref:2-hydroxyacid dehydrogenase n=1 Tax=Tropicimonas sp. TaxID=2067044 RepID=UPI003A8C1F37